MSMAIGLLGFFGAATAGRPHARRNERTAPSVLGLDWLITRPRGRK